MIGTCHTHKGTTYFSSITEAYKVSASLKEAGNTWAKVVSYGRGYAVQLRRSGPYYCV